VNYLVLCAIGILVVGYLIWRFITQRAKKASEVSVSTAQQIIIGTGVDTVVGDTPSILIAGTGAAGTGWSSGSFGSLTPTNPATTGLTLVGLYYSPTTTYGELLFAVAPPESFYTVYVDGVSHIFNRYAGVRYVDTFFPSNKFVAGNTYEITMFP
jgi:hypothetical protein